MSKELEALKEIFNGMYNKQGFIKEFKAIEKALTPPTADELCKELSEYFEQDVKCIYGMFYYGEDLQFTEICNTTIDALNGDQLYDIYLSLPPTLLKRIALFYENEVK